MTPLVGAVVATLFSCSKTTLAAHMLGFATLPLQLAAARRHLA